MNKIIIFAAYATSDKIADGMFQRIKSIDRLIESNIDKIYFNLSYKINLRYCQIRHDSKTIEYKANIFINYFRLLRQIVQADIIYFHSIYNFSKIVLFLPFLKRTSLLILDMHGAVPEELQFYKRTIISKVYNFIELLAFKKCKYFIHVSSSMKDFYNSKYSFSKQKNHIIYPIIGDTIINHNFANISDLYEELGLVSSDTIYIYSGNTQKWQNIDLILLKMKTLLKNDHIKFIILTNNIKEFNSLLEKYQLHDSKNIIIRRVDVSELNSYYHLAHYGFIIRDEHILNKVACPTKLLEYLSNGIIPVMKFDEIGDFKKLCCEYVNIDCLNDKLPPKKSLKNKKIFEEYVSNNSSSKIKRLLTLNG